MNCDAIERMVRFCNILEIGEVPAKFEWDRAAGGLERWKPFKARVNPPSRYSQVAMCMDSPVREQRSCYQKNGAVGMVGKLRGKRA